MRRTLNDNKASDLTDEDGAMEVVQGIMSVEINKNNNRPFSPFFEAVRPRWVLGCDLLEYGTCKTVALSCKVIINWTDV